MYKNNIFNNNIIIKAFTYIQIFYCWPKIIKIDKIVWIFNKNILYSLALYACNNNKIIEVFKDTDYFSVSLLYCTERLTAGKINSYSYYLYIIFTIMYLDIFINLNRRSEINFKFNSVLFCNDRDLSWTSMLGWHGVYNRHKRDWSHWSI